MDEKYLKDLFAMVAMHAILNRVVNIDPQDLAEDAYAAADAMMEVRGLEVGDGNE